MVSHIGCSREPDGRWVARVYDLPGLQLYGDSQEDALAAAKKVTAMLLPESNREDHRIRAFYPDRSPDSGQVAEHATGSRDIPFAVNKNEEAVLQ